MKKKDMSQNMCQKIEDSAKGFGGDMLITACPLCKYNLNKNASSELPVYYFTGRFLPRFSWKDYLRSDR